MRIFTLTDKMPVHWVVGSILIVLTCVLAAEDSDRLIAAIHPEPAPADVPEGTPIFLLEPEPHYYIVKGKPVRIVCRAAPAVIINVRCRGVWYAPQSQNNEERTEDGVRYLQTSVEVSQDDVVEYFGSDGYNCECHAINILPGNKGERFTAVSRKGMVEEAYLRKSFPQEPISTAVELHSSAQLQCRPPKGVPTPVMFWTKDGVEIDIYNEINYIISSEGNLIISQTTLDNAGNYTCGAYNIANRRLSESATVTVYQNGKWASWGPWSECSTKCGKGFQRRSRHCTSPSPMNGGQDCFGEGVQRVPCSSVCPVSGMWSTWSSWSTCAPDCRHHRRRLCDNPKPQNGGSYCDGSDLATANCSSGLCKDAVSWDSSTGDGVGVVLEESIAMYVGLIVAIGVFIAIVVIIVTLLRRRTSNSGADDKKLNKGNGDMMSAQPDLTQTVVTIQNHGAMDGAPNNNHLLPRHLDNKSPVPSANSSAYANDNTLNMQKAALLMDNKMMERDPDLEAKDLLLDPALSRPDSLYTEIHPNRTSSVAGLASQLPNNLDLEAMVWATITHAGGRINMPDSGVTVTIPEAAIKKGTSEEMFVAVCRDDKDRPKLTEHQTVLGPVIVIGPPGLPLKKPVIISFQHCASIKHGQWALSLYGSDTSYDEHPQWQMLSRLGEETINTPLYVQVDARICHVMTEHMLRYVLVGEPSGAGKAVKALRLAAFAPLTDASAAHTPAARPIDYNVRVYFVEDAHDALESVYQVERKLGGRLLDKPKQILFQCGGGNLCLAMEELGPGWNCKLAANYQEIPFGHIWSGTQNGLHCSFALEHHDRSQQQLQCTVHVFQKNLLDNSQALQIACSLSEKMPNSPAHMVGHAHGTPQRNATVTSSTGGGHRPTVSLDSPQHVFRLPVHIKHKLCQILDPPNTRGNDWRMLAQRLSVDRYINFFATKRSPTEHILDLWEARHRDKAAVTELMNSLRVMGRMDATAVLEKECGAWL